jgi:hypothetical protein
MRIDDDVLRLNISVHDAFAVTVIERLEQLIEIVSDLKISHVGN